MRLYRILYQLPGEPASEPQPDVIRKILAHCRSPRIKAPISRKLHVPGDRPRDMLLSTV